MFKIEIKHHIFLFCLTTTLWTFFLLGGLSSEYYLLWPFGKSLLLINALPAIALIPLGYYVLKHIIGHDFIVASFWAAFYASVPLIFYDYLYIAVHLKVGLSFFKSHWYLTTFYFIPWVVLPLVAVRISKQHVETIEEI